MEDGDTRFLPPCSGRTAILDPLFGNAPAFIDSRPLGIKYRIDGARLAKSFEPQLAAITAATGSAVRLRVIATPREPVIDAELAARLNDLRFGHVQQGGMNF